MFTGSSFGTVRIDLGPISLCDIEFCCEGPGQSEITISTVPGFDTVVGGTTVWDPYIDQGIINLTQVAPACTCEIIGPAFVQADMIMPVTEQYTVTPGDVCENQPDYVWSDNCVNADVDQTGLLHVPPTTEQECCTITVIDNANTDINTGEPIWCDFPICLEGG
jgi:hypothetical protein